MSAAKPDEPRAAGPSARRAGRRVKWLIVYLLLLALSQVFVRWRQPDILGVTTPPDGAGSRRTVSVAPVRRDAAVPGPQVDISLLKFEPARPAPGRLPVILLHGSPSGGASDFNELAGAVAATGREVYALDFPGFGRSTRYVPDYSIIANARYTLQAMDALNLHRAHVVGWSQGGGSAMWAGDLSPQRVASVTLLGSIGVQDAEGSGSYAFEHVKYAVGWGLLVGLPQLVPHFGLLGPDHYRNAFIRNFMDSDQRELDAVMQRLTQPTLILHGRRDFLVPDWCAEVSHQNIRSSRLVMLDASHFFPLGAGRSTGAIGGLRANPARVEAFRQACGAMTSFFDRHDDPQAPPLVGAAAFRAHESHIKNEVGGIHIDRGMDWWLVILAIVVGTLILEDLTLVAVGILIVDGQIDPFVGLAGCFVGIVFGDMGLWAIGRVLGRRLLKFRLLARFINEKSLQRWGEMMDGHMGKAIFLCRCIPGTRMPTYIAAGMLGRRGAQFVFWELVAVCLWAPGLLILSALIGPRLLGVFREVFHGPVAIVIALVVVFFIIRAITAEATYEGRHKNKANLQRLWRYEFWPVWLFYLPLIPVILWHALRRGPMTFTCANPGIENGGGIIGESKSLILRSLLAGRPWDQVPVAPFEFIPAGPDPAARAAIAIDAVRSNPTLAGYPVILKPDQGQRGMGLKLARNDDDVRAWFRAMPRDAMIQRFISLPHEIGVFWTRVPPAGDDTTPMDDRPGEVFSVTHKVFPVIEGDGVRTLEHLIWSHPRYQMQAAVFLKRFDNQRERVLAKGERMSLGVSGNHCQGTQFLDGASLLTPALSARIEELAQSFRGNGGARLDFGRFDIRYRSEESLAQGREFVIIELNGTTSESTNIYDPGMSLGWAYSVLAAQWDRLYRIGAARRRAGVPPMSLRGLLGLMRAWRTLGTLGLGSD